MQWVSIVMCWVATGLNIYAMIRLNRCRKRYEKKENELDAEREYCTVLMSACNNYMKARQEELKSIMEEENDG
jgi:hypothetical protein